MTLSLVASEFRGAPNDDTAAAASAAFPRERMRGGGGSRILPRPRSAGHSRGRRNYRENERTKVTSVPRDELEQFVSATKRGEASWSRSSDPLFLALTIREARVFLPQSVRTLRA